MNIFLIHLLILQSNIEFNQIYILSDATAKLSTIGNSIKLKFIND